MKVKNKNCLYLLGVSLSLVVVAFILIVIFLQRESILSINGKQTFGDPMLDVVDPPNSPPTCSVLKEEKNPENIVRVIVEDDSPGIWKISIKESNNAHIEVPVINTDEHNVSPKWVLVTVSKIDASKRSSATLELFDMGGSKSICDLSEY